MLGWGSDLCWAVRLLSSVHPSLQPLLGALLPFTSVVLGCLSISWKGREARAPSSRGGAGRRKMASQPSWEMTGVQPNRASGLRTEAVGRVTRRRHPSVRQPRRPRLVVRCVRTREVGDHGPRRPLRSEHRDTGLLRGQKARGELLSS